MRKIKENSSPAQTASSTFDQGRERQLDVVVGPKGVHIKAHGLKGWKFCSWPSIYVHAAAAEAGFDPAPRSGRMKRGGVS